MSTTSFPANYNILVFFALNLIPITQFSLNGSLFLLNMVLWSNMNENNEISWSNTIKTKFLLRQRNPPEVFLQAYLTMVADDNLHYM